MNEKIRDEYNFIERRALLKMISPSKQNFRLVFKLIQGSEVSLFEILREIPTYEKVAMLYGKSVANLSTRFK